MKHQAKKRFGQNFLKDTSIINALIESIRPRQEDIMIEIGPGFGAMTKPLLGHLDHLHVIEIDRDIIQWMQSEYKANQVMIHHSDVLKFDFQQLTQLGPIRVVGNLPYNISSPILFKLMESSEHIIDMHFMLQKEVVERMVASPGHSEYGRLSVMLQYKWQMEYLITVPPESFDPAPKVESAFVRCVPFKSLPNTAHDENLFARVVQSAFGQRRKTLRNTLKNFLNDADFTRLGIDSQLRAEALDVKSFVEISNYLSNRK